MARTKKAEQHTWYQNGNLKSLLIGLTAVGGVSVGGASYSQSSKADERTAKLETKVEQLQKDSESGTRKLERVDKRTIRMEEQLKAISGKMGIRPPRDED